MNKQNQPVLAQPATSTPQIRIRSNVSAGGSLENCQANLEYWRKIYNQRCLFK